MNSHQDFIYIPEPLADSIVTHAEKKPRKPNDIAREAGSLAWRIRNECPDPNTWRARIEAADPELRECLRAYLKQAYREMQQRARRESEGGKKSAAAEEAIAELAKRYGGAT